MRSRILLISAFLGLMACQEPTATNPAGGSEERGSFAMRIPAQVVAAAQTSADSIAVRVVPLVEGARPVMKNWPLREGELLFEQIPVAPCSVFVSLFSKSGERLFAGATVVTIQPGRTANADINLAPTTGALNINVRIDPYVTTLANPIVTPAAGLYQGSVAVSLTHPVGKTVIQYRIENATTGSSSPWIVYSRTFTLSQTSVLFVRAINGSDTGAHRSYTYFIGNATLFNNFETPSTSPIGWAGGIWKGGSASVSVLGSREVPGPWGTAAARLDYVLDGDATGSSWISALFEAPAGIDWTRFAALRLKVRSSTTRSVTIQLDATDPAYKVANQSGGYLRYPMTVGPLTDEIVVKASDFDYSPTYGGTRVPLASILPTVRGILLGVSCRGVECKMQEGTLEIDDIIIDMN